MLELNKPYELRLPEQHGTLLQPGVRLKCRGEGEAKFENRIPVMRNRQGHVSMVCVINTDRILKGTKVKVEIHNIQTVHFKRMFNLEGMRLEFRHEDDALAAYLVNVYGRATHKIHCDIIR